MRELFCFSGALELEGGRGRVGRWMRGLLKDRERESYGVGAAIEEEGKSLFIYF